MGGEVSTDFKSLNRIEISWLVQVLLNFDWFWGSPLGSGGRWIVVEVTRGCSLHMCTHMCKHTHACMCMCVWHHREFPGISPLGAAICMKLSCLPRMHVRVCVCMHACRCMYMCKKFTPQPSPNPIHPTPPHPQSCREPKTPKFNKSWTNQGNWILFEDSFPLNIPELI